MKYRIFFQYFLLMKPGIILGNLFSVLGGFFLASQKNINFSLLFWALLSTSLLIASSCFLNNYFDFDIDQNMERTKKKILIGKKIFLETKMVFFSIFLGILGFFLLYFKINTLVSCFGCIGLFLYVFIYTYMKRISVHSTLLGSISGAIPPLIGYCSIGKIDFCAFILFFMYFLWQIPHFYSIAIIHYKDYQKVNIPVFPIKFGISYTKYHITLYIFLFILFSSMLTFLKFIGYNYFIITNIFNIFWLINSVRGILKKNIVSFFWAKKMFLFSIVIIMITNIMIVVDKLHSFKYKGIVKISMNSEIH